MRTFGGSIVTRRLIRLGVIVSLAAAAPVVAQPVVAQDGALTVVALSAGAAEGQPGEIVTVPFRVTNSATSAQRVEPVLELPTGWIPLLPARTPLDLGAGESALVIAGFRLPPRAPPDRYVVVLTMASPDGGTPRSTGSLEVVVHPQYDLRLRTLAVPETVDAGEAFEVTFRVENAGTTPVTVTIEATSLEAAGVTPEPREHVLSPGASADGVARVRTEPDRQRTYRVVLRAALRESPDVARSVTVHVRAQRLDLRAAEQPGLPLYLTLAGAQRGEDPTGLVELASSLRHGSSGRSFDMLLRVPSGPTSTLLPRQDHYSLRFGSRGLDLLAGDHTYRLSPLTEPGRNGFGGQAAVRLGPWRATGYHLRLRHGALDHRQVAGALGVQPFQGLEVSAQYLRADGWQPSEVATLRAVATPMRGHNVEAEAGTSLRVGTPGTAYSLSADGNEAWLRYHVRYLDTPLGYTGRLSGLTTRAAGVSVHPTKWLDVRTEWRDHAQAGATGSGAPVRQRLTERGRAGVGLRWRTATNRLDVYGGYMHRRLTLGEMLLDRREAAAELRAGLGLGPFTANATVEAGHVYQAGLVPSDFVRVTFQTFLKRPRHSLGVNLRLVTGVSAVQLAPRDYASLGANASLDVGGRTRLFFDGRLTMYAGETGSPTVLVQARAEHRLPNGGLITLRGRSHATHTYGAPPLQRWEFGVAYTVPLHVGLPTASPPQLIGQVLDAETGEGIAGARLHIGDLRVDAGPDGTFSVTRPRAGTYEVSVDRLSIGIERVVAREAPSRVDITDGGTAPVVITVLRRAAVSGRLFIPGNAEEGIPRAALELDDGHHATRTLTDDEGRFHFGDLQPGPWTLRVIRADLPPHHHLVQAVFPLTLEPGEDHQVEVEARARERTTRMVEGGTLQARPRDSEPTSEATPAVVASLRGGGKIVPSAGGYTWIVGSYAASRASAERIAARYREEGYRTSILAAPFRGGTTYRVALGQFRTYGTAARARSRLPHDVPDDAWLYPLR